ncbi:MAG TPA: hypothetical protein VH985_01230 [Candidatus Binatia bacterium]|jgi:hypothetical protein
MRIGKTLLGAFVGLVVGYFIGVYVACDWLYPASNLCGIYGVFITGSIGLLIDVVVGWKTS